MIEHWVALTAIGAYALVAVIWAGVILTINKGTDK